MNVVIHQCVEIEPIVCRFLKRFAANERLNRVKTYRHIGK